MLRIAICDDEKAFTDFVQRSACQLTEQLSLVADINAFTTAEDLLEQHKRNRFHIIFLDIDMPHISGFDAAAKIRKISLDTFIVFITAKRELVYDSFEFTPFYFICKSSGYQIQSELRHVFEKLAAIFKQNKQLILYDSVLGEDIIPIKDIVYIQSDKHYLLYHIVGEDMPRKERKVLSARRTELDQYDFISPHKRYLVNMHHIKCFDTFVNTIIVTNGDKIPISRNQKDATLEKYRIFKRR